MWQWMSRGSKDSLKRAQAIIDDVKPNLESIRDYEMDVIDSTGAVVADKSKTAFRVVQCSTTDYTETTFDKIQDIADSRDSVGGRPHEAGNYIADGRQYGRSWASILVLCRIWLNTRWTGYGHRYFPTRRWRSSGCGGFLRP
jgi:hypothetical protein